MASGSTAAFGTLKKCTKIYIITTGLGEHRGIGTLKKCKNKNVHHYKCRLPPPTPGGGEYFMYIITTGLGEHRGIGTLKKCKNKNVLNYNWHEF